MVKFPLYYCSNNRGSAHHKCRQKQDVKKNLKLHCRDFVARMLIYLLRQLKSRFMFADSKPRVQIDNELEDSKYDACSEELCHCLQDYIETLQQLPKAKIMDLFQRRYLPSVIVTVLFPNSTYN